MFRHLLERRELKLDTFMGLHAVLSHCFSLSPWTDSRGPKGSCTVSEFTWIRWLLSTAFKILFIWPQVVWTLLNVPSNKHKYSFPWRSKPIGKERLGCMEDVANSVRFWPSCEELWYSSDLKHSKIS